MGTYKHSKTHRYAAFISYAHTDEAMAARLHKALEIYPVPRHLRAQGKTTKPIFRDIAELTAAHSLSEKIREAVKGSRVLIVLCSPAAKASHWVNEEIRLFRELHGDAGILSAIMEGTPETAFPDALIKGGREPLAAALGADKAGFKLGVTQLAAGMLGTGLDELVQREAKRRQKIMGAGLAASLVLSGVMGFATLQAVEARKEAELERSESEALLEYMVKDLKVKLEPVGRLELLEGVGRRAIKYYDKKDIADLSDDNLRLLAAARQVLAQVALDAGRMEEAQKDIEASADLTREVLERNPDDTDAIFAHAQSEFWVGKYYFDQGRLQDVEPYWNEYDRLSQDLHQRNPDNFDWIMEAAWSANALGAYYDRQREYVLSGKAYEKAVKYAELAIQHSPENPMPRNELANILAGQARAALYILPFEEIDALRQKQEDIYRKALLDNPENQNLRYLKSLGKFRRYVDLERFRANSNHDNLNESILGFERLVKHDWNNETWSERHFAAKFYKLDYYYNTDVEKYKQLYKDFTKAAIIYLNAIESPSRKRSYEFSYELSKLRFSLLENKKHEYSLKLDQLNNIHYNIIAVNPDDALIDSILMKENYFFENKKYAQLFAKKYLNYSWMNSAAQPPAILHNKIIAFSILNDCAAAKRGVESLLRRDFVIPKEYNIICT